MLTTRSHAPLEAADRPVPSRPVDSHAKTTKPSSLTDCCVASFLPLALEAVVVPRSGAQAGVAAKHVSVELGHRERRKTVTGRVQQTLVNQPRADRARLLHGPIDPAGDLARTMRLRAQVEARE